MKKESVIDELYSEFPYSYSLKYSAKFKPYRANIKLRKNHIEANLSKKWMLVSEDIQIGLIQELLLKLLKNRLKPLKTNTQNIELYNIFMKKIHLIAPKTELDPVLEESFNRVNEKYFYNFLEKPNLIWGFPSLAKLGSYEYGSDTIAISKILENVNKEMLDYIMYHEMLHKKHKFIKKRTKNYHHTLEFKRKEKEFENSELIETRLRNLLRKKMGLLNRIGIMNEI